MSISSEDQQLVLETAAQLCKRLEATYDFTCDGGSLKNCFEWQELRRIIALASPRAEVGTCDVRDDQPPQAH